MDSVEVGLEEPWGGSHSIINRLLEEYGIEEQTKMKQDEATEVVKA